MFPIVFFVLTIVGATTHTLVAKTGVVETFLLYALVIEVGLQGLFAFGGHYFRAEMVARSIGWPAGNPFQKEIAFTNLSFGILGILCIGLRGNFWCATAIGYSIFLLGAASVHIQELREHRNVNIGNAGPVLFADVLIPAALLSLLIAYNM